MNILTQSFAPFAVVQFVPGFLRPGDAPLPSWHPVSSLPLATLHGSVSSPEFVHPGQHGTALPELTAGVQRQHLDVDNITVNGLYTASRFRGCVLQRLHLLAVYVIEEVSWLYFS